VRYEPQRYATEAIEGQDRGRDEAHVGAPKAQERRVAAAVRGRRVKGSGCSPYAKGDVVAEAHAGAAGWLIECKRTEKASLSLKRAWLVKVAREAVVQGKRPALAVAMAGGAPAGDVELDWVLVPLSLFTRLMQGEQEVRDEQA
jgi:Holliday junction resolvase